MIKFDGFHIFCASLCQLTIIVTAYIPTDIVSQESKRTTIGLFAALTLAIIWEAYVKHRKEKTNESMNLHTKGKKRK